MSATVHQRLGAMMFNWSPNDKLGALLFVVLVAVVITTAPALAKLYAWYGVMGF